MGHGDRDFVRDEVDFNRSYCWICCMLFAEYSVPAEKTDVWWRLPVRTRGASSNPTHIKMKHEI